MLLNSILKILPKILPNITAYAHCDVPCGIYDPKAAQVAAATVVRMNELIEALDVPGSLGKIELAKYQNSMTRYVLNKEEHAGKCKTELLILWTDYFKPEHLEKYPDLHDKFWKAAKLCSKNKQEVNLSAAKELVKAVNEIASIFNETKKA